MVRQENEVEPSGLEEGMKWRRGNEIRGQERKDNAKGRRATGKEEWEAGGRLGFKAGRTEPRCQRAGETAEGISRYRDHSQLMNVPFSQAAVMKAIFLDLS